MSASSDTIKILTLLNVAQAKPMKRKRESARDWFQLAKNAKKSASSSLSHTASSAGATQEIDMDAVTERENEDEQEEKDDGELPLPFPPCFRILEKKKADRFRLDLSLVDAKRDSYERHWTPECALVAHLTVEELAQLRWKKSSRKVMGMGDISEMNVEGVKADVEEQESMNVVSVMHAERLADKVADIFACSIQYNARLMAKLKTYMSTSPRGVFCPMPRCTTNTSTNLYMTMDRNDHANPRCILADSRILSRHLLSQSRSRSSR